MKKRIYSLSALSELPMAANRRYLQFIASFDDISSGIKLLKKLSKTVVANNRPYKGFNLFSDDDQKIFESIASGEFNISGFQNKNLRAKLAHKKPAQISMINKRLRTHGLVKKIGRSYKYYLTNTIKFYPSQIGILFNIMIFLFFLTALTGCSIPDPIENTVEKTTKTIKRTSRSITRTITLDDQDLIRTIGIFNFENHSLRESRNFQKIFHKGLPQYINDTCQGVLVPDPESGSLLNLLKTPPRLETGITDNFSLAAVGRQLGLSAIVTGSLEDIRIMDELRGIWITKDTHHLVQVFIRVEVCDTRTATKLLDETFDRQIEIDDLEYQIIQERDKINLPQLNDTLNKLLTDVGDSICDTIKDQPWTGYITKIDGSKLIIPSGSRTGLKLGDILEVYDSSRIIEGVGGQRFFTPGLKIGEIEIVNITENKSEARLIKGEGIIGGSTVRRKD